MFPMSSRRSSRSSSSRSTRNHSPISLRFNQDCDFTFMGSQSIVSTPASSVLDLSIPTHSLDHVRAPSSWLGFNRLSVDSESENEPNNESESENEDVILSNLMDQMGVTEVDNTNLFTSIPDLSNGEYTVEEYTDHEGVLSGDEDHNAIRNEALLNSTTPSTIPFLHNTFLVRDTMHDLIETIGLPGQESYSADMDKFLRQSSLDVVKKRSLLPNKMDAEYLSLKAPHLDYQGIEWDQTRRSRASYDTKISQLRRKRYVSYSDHYKIPKNQLLSTITTRMEHIPLFKFKAMLPKPQLFIPHFQIRQLLCPLSKNTIFYPLLSYDEFNIQQLDPDTGETKTVIGKGGSQPMYNRTCVVSSMDANEEFLVVGCYDGQYIFRSMNSINNSSSDDQASGISSGVISHNSSDMINHTTITHGTYSPAKAIFSSNDATVTTIDLTTNQTVHTYTAPNSTNCTAYSPTHPRLRLLQGDFKSSLIIDTDSSDQRPILTLDDGQLDFGSSCAWSPRDSHIIATGNQDGVCRIYDLRSAQKPLHSLLTTYELPVRAMRFDARGRYLAFAEPVDNIMILDSRTDFNQGQTVNVLGEIAGIGFNEDEDAEGGAGGTCLSVGIADSYIGGIMQFECQGEGRGLDWGVF